MRSRTLKVARIGNSRGIRIPAETLRRYRIGDDVTMEEHAGGILLRPRGSATVTLSWAETAREMALGAEDWSEWNTTAADGLDSVPWYVFTEGREARKSSAHDRRRLLKRSRAR